MKMSQEKYNYKNMSIPGGGYVTGFIYSESEKDVLYARTDIGGVYRFDYDNQKWQSLVDHVTMEDLRETFPISVAIDEKHPGRMYIASGINGEETGLLSISEDYGDSFSYSEIPTMVHGNLNGRGTGERLIVDNINSDVLYFASQTGGLFKSEDRGKSFTKIASMPEDYLTFIGQTKDGKALIVGTAGVTTKRSEKLRGYGLYVSFDEGESFNKMWQPQDGEVEAIKLAGMVPQRWTSDDEYLYVTFSVMGRNAYVLENGYSCDGGSVEYGRVVRYDLKNLTADGEDITPTNLTAEGANATPTDIFENAKSITSTNINKTNAAQISSDSYGFSGISKVGNTLVVSTISKEDGDCIFRSFDKGQTWECILHGLETGKMRFRTSYMKPEYNGGSNLIHWLTSLAIDPFNEKEMWFNTGTGAFRTKNLNEDTVVFNDYSDGIEETVHLNLYSPVSGDVKVIDILGDLGGFAFTQFDKPCDNSFADENGNRYITCLNADVSDINPNLVVVTPRGNWTGKTKGGLIVSKDQCKTFERFKMPFGITPDIDDALRNMENPNVNSGWVAMSADGRHIVWSIAYWNNLPVDRVIVSHDAGKSFSKVRVVDYENNLIADEKHDPLENARLKVFSDRCCSNVFYGFGEGSRLYVSIDFGATFIEIDIPHNLPRLEMGLVDCANKTEIRAEAGKMGVFYLALREEGLWKLEIDAHNKSAKAKKLSKDGDIVYRMGLGKGSPHGEYMEESKAIYMAAKIQGVYGFYRTIDECKSFSKLNDDRQCFGEINSIEGDSQVYGRFYIGTGTRGLLYGEPLKE